MSEGRIRKIMRFHHTKRCIKDAVSVRPALLDQLCAARGSLD